VAKPNGSIFVELAPSFCGRLFTSLPVTRSPNRSGPTRIIITSARTRRSRIMQRSERWHTNGFGSSSAAGKTESFMTSRPISSPYADDKHCWGRLSLQPPMFGGRRQRVSKNSPKIPLDGLTQKTTGSFGRPCILFLRVGHAFSPLEHFPHQMFPMHCPKKFRAGGIREIPNRAEAPRRPYAEAGERRAVRGPEAVRVYEGEAATLGSCA